MHPVWSLVVAVLLILTRVAFGFDYQKVDRFQSMFLLYVKVLSLNGTRIAVLSLGRRRRRLISLMSLPSLDLV